MIEIYVVREYAFKNRDVAEAYYEALNREAYFSGTPAQDFHVVTVKLNGTIEGDVLDLEAISKIGKK